MTPLEAGVGIFLAVVPAASAIWMRYYAAQDAREIRNEAKSAALELKAEAAAATLKAREAAVAAKEASGKLDGVAKQLDGRLTQFFKEAEESRIAMEKRIDEAFVRGAAAGRAVTVETEITKGQAKIEKTLENQDVKSEARHVELKNGTLNGTLNGSKERKP